MISFNICKVMNSKLKKEQRSNFLYVKEQHRFEKNNLRAKYIFALKILKKLKSFTSTCRRTF